MRDRIVIRQMKVADAEGVYRTSSEAIPTTEEERQQVRNRSAQEVERRKERYRHFLEHGPERAWVAADGDRIAGVALAPEREGVWLLSLFAVDEDPLLRRLQRGHAPLRLGRLHAPAHADGRVRRSSLPAGLKTREGTEEHLRFAAEVGRIMRGAAHGPDLEFMLRTGHRMLVNDAAGRGYAVIWDGSPALLAATTPETYRAVSHQPNFRRRSQRSNLLLQKDSAGATSTRIAQKS